jgi:outer membrane receptor protein involved in Fe transport
VVNNTAVIRVETSKELSLFASYRLNDHWLFRANIDNALDKAYVLGGQGAAFIDPSLPRNYSLSTTYRF